MKFKAKDGKFYSTDCANISGILRIIQSIPSKKAESFELWLAKATTNRVTRYKNSTGFPKLKRDTNGGGQATGQAGKNIEDKIKEKVSTPKNYLGKITKKIN